MPSWNEVLTEILADNSPAKLDNVRRKYLKKLAEERNRNVICYYSGWLQKNNTAGVEINDNDKNAFMATVHGLDRSLGLDLILHTPGGNIAATESIVDYLRTMFDDDIQVFVPQLAMSAGTMIACSSKKIIMGKQSSLGPIDPHINLIPAIGVLEEFKKAKAEIVESPSSIPLWQVIIGKYHPTFIGECENAIKWSGEIVTEWLVSNMFKDNGDAEKLASDVVSKLLNRSDMKAHARHISVEKCKEIGLKIEDLESDGVLQDLVLTVHHAYMHTFHGSAIKIVENHKGVAMVNHHNPNKKN